MLMVNRCWWPLCMVPWGLTSAHKWKFIIPSLQKPASSVNKMDERNGG
jgi:hypothetical protein